MTDFDVVVVGGGIFGSFSAIALAETALNSEKIALLDQYENGHERGSSHGDGRIYRSVYGSKLYLDMMKLAYPHWHDLEKYNTGKAPIMTRTGTLVLDTQDTGWSVKPMHSALQKYGFPYEILSNDDVRQRFPAVVPCNGRPALFSPDGGVVRATDSVKAAWNKAKHLGVETINNFRVVGLDIAKDNDSDIVIHAEDGRVLKTKKIVIAAGAWLSKILDSCLGIRTTTRVTVETVCYFKPYENDTTKHVPDHSSNKNGMPTFLFGTDNSINSLGYYGVPDVGSGLKLGAHGTGSVISDPDEDREECFPYNTNSMINRKGAENAKEVVESCRGFIRTFFPYLNPEPVKTLSCLYTSSPSLDYVISKVAEYGDRVVVAGCGSGHGFKCAPTVGFCAAALIYGNVPPVPVEDLNLGNILAKEGVDITSVDFSGTASR